MLCNRGYTYLVEGVYFASNRGLAPEVNLGVCP